MNNYEEFKKNISKYIGLAICAFGTGFFLNNSFSSSQESYSTEEMKIFFVRPKRERNFGEEPVSKEIIKVIDNENKSIRIQAFAFTSIPISHALVRAHQRGVTVKITIDKQYESQFFDRLKFLADSGVIIHVRELSGLSHRKTFVLEETGVVIFGSYNFTDGADNRNDEVLCIAQSHNIAKRFIQEFDECFKRTRSIDFHKSKAKAPAWQQNFWKKGHTTHNTNSDLECLKDAIRSASSSIYIHLNQNLPHDIEDAVIAATKRFINVQCITYKAGLSPLLASSKAKFILQNTNKGDSHTTIIIDKTEIFRLKDDKITKVTKANTQKEATQFEKKFAKLVI